MFEAMLTLQCNSATAAKSAHALKQVDAHVRLLLPGCAGQQEQTKRELAFPPSGCAARVQLPLQKPLVGAEQVAALAVACVSTAHTPLVHASSTLKMRA